MQCGTSKIIGCRFSLHPMDSEFISIIQGALAEVDLSTVWRHTDDVSTVIRGEGPHVFNALTALTEKAASHGKHMAMNATFSVGCPGDTAGDSYMGIEDAVKNDIPEGPYVSSQFSLYPLNQSDYMETIYREINRAKERGVYNESMHYATGIHGSLKDVFAFYEETFSEAQIGDHPHVVMTINMSIHSPSHGGAEHVS